MNVHFDVAPARAMEEAEGFFGSLGAYVLERQGMSFTTAVNHPDLLGRAMILSCRIGDEGGVLELRRLSGDIILFELVHELFLRYDMGNGRQASFYKGQILPSTSSTCQPHPEDFPEWHLEGSGQKQKMGKVEDYQL